MKTENDVYNSKQTNNLQMMTFVPSTSSLKASATRPVISHNRVSSQVIVSDKTPLAISGTGNSG